MSAPELIRLPSREIGCINKPVMQHMIIPAIENDMKLDRVFAGLVRIPIPIPTPPQAIACSHRDRLNVANGVEPNVALAKIELIRDFGLVVIVVSFHST